MGSFSRFSRLKVGKKCPQILQTITRTNEKCYPFVRVILGLLKLPVQKRKICTVQVILRGSKFPGKTGNISRLYG
jgi:hypothetical protein